MRRVRLLLLAVLVAALAAACGGGGGGGGSEGGGGAGGGEGAKLIPADVAVYLSVNTDFESDQWQAVDALVKRFPAGGQGLQTLFSQLSSSDVNFETDVKPVLGPEVDVAVLDLTGVAAAATGSGSTQAADQPAVFVTQPKDAAKFEALLAKGTDKPVWQVQDGWYVVAPTQAVLDRVLAGAKTAALADSEAFKSAMDALSADSVASLWLNGASLTKAFTDQLQENPVFGSVDPIGQAGKLVSVAMGVVAGEQGFKIDGVVKTEGAPEPQTYKADLPSVAPGGAVVYASFSNLRTALEQLLDVVGKTQPDFDQQLGQLQSALGINLETDVLPLFEGEHALYVRPGAPIPEVTLLLSPADPAAGAATLDKLVMAAGLLGASGGTSSVTPSDVTIGGVQAKKLDFGSAGFSLYYAAVGENLVLTTAETGIADLAAGGRLADDALFQEASQAAGLPDETLGFVFLDFDQTLSLIEGLGASGTLGSLDAAQLENVRAIKYVLAYVTGGGGELRFSGFVGIK